MSSWVTSVLHGRLNTAPIFVSITFPSQSWAGSKPFPSHTWKSPPGISQIGLSTVAVQDPDSVPPGLLSVQVDTLPLVLVLYNGMKMVCRSDPDIGGSLAFSTPMMLGSWCGPEGAPLPAHAGPARRAANPANFTIVRISVTPNFQRVRCAPVRPLQPKCEPRHRSTAKFKNS